MVNGTNTAAESKTNIYVFAEFWKQFSSVNGYDKITDFNGRISRKGTVRYHGKTYPVEYRDYGCGVYRVPCIFVPEENR